VVLNKSLLISVAGILVASSQMLATPVAPGAANLAVTPIVAPPGSTYQGSSTTPFSFTYKGGSVTGNVVAAVYQETGGTEDFYYQVDNLNAKGVKGSISSISIADYTSYSTNASTVTPPYNSSLQSSGFGTGSKGNYAPTGVSRAADGSALTFTFKGLTAGQNSSVLLIQTDATTFDQLGYFTVANGNSISTYTFEPAPEPGFYGSLAVAIAGVILVVRRRSSKANAAA
jgi:hypothetical protein